jgi:hypothetical protein
MDTLDREIAALKAEIEEHNTILRTATSPEEKSDLRRLIISTREHLIRLLDDKKRIGGKFHMS